MNEILNDIESTEVVDRDLLAVVYRVERLEAIPNKDRIELVHLKDCGYTTICEKGHKVGDMVVFIKYDSIVPDNELFAFMKEYKFRVKPRSFTERDENNEVVKKIYSQGIVLPVPVVIDYLKTIGLSNLQIITESCDLTEVLGIKKYIPPVIGTGSSFGQMIKKSDFPTHIISKTDELNVCSKMRALEEIQGVPVYITQKIEGSSLTFYLDDYTHELIVCSRNNMLYETETCKFWLAVNKHNIKEKLLQVPHLAFQAECYGVGIQKNKLGIPDVDLAVFNIVDKKDRRRLNWYDMLVVERELEIPLVPVCCEVLHFDWSFDKLQEYADIQKYNNGVVAEGFVVRPFEPFYSNVLKELWSVKCINRNYTL
jgi:RNA ligase (TIGR02306 family)